MPIRREINHNFFKKWSPEMAYVFGFFTADGSMYRTKRDTYFIEFQITDGDLLKKIRKTLNSSHKIAVRQRTGTHKTVYRLQIGSGVIFHDLINFGLTPNKSKNVTLPSVPARFFGDFVRGYFDGDGNVWAGIVHKKRKKVTSVLVVGFTSGSKRFLSSLGDMLKDSIGLRGGSFQYWSGAFRLRYSTLDSLKLCQFMYYNSSGLRLSRKKVVFDTFLRRRNGSVV